MINVNIAVHIRASITCSFFASRTSLSHLSLPHKVYTSQNDEGFHLKEVLFGHFHNKKIAE